MQHFDKIAILAPTMWGKTTLATQLVPSFKRVIIVDVVNGFPQLDETDFVAESIAELAEISKLCVHHKAKEFRIIRRYPDNFQGDYAEDLDHIIKIALVVGNVMLIVDEFQEFMRREQMSATLKTLILRGRHKGVGIMGISQRPQEISKTFLEQCASIFAGGFNEPNSLGYFEGIFGKIKVNSMRKLKQSEFIHFERPNKFTKIGPLFTRK